MSIVDGTCNLFRKTGRDIYRDIDDAGFRPSAPEGSAASPLSMEGVPFGDLDPPGVECPC